MISDEDNTIRISSDEDNTQLKNYATLNMTVMNITHSEENTDESTTWESTNLKHIQDTTRCDINHSPHHGNTFLKEIQ